MHVAIDMGGTNTRVASSTNLKDIYKVERFLTSKLIDRHIQNIGKAISNVCGKNRLRSLIMGVPGTLDFGNKRFVKLPHYPMLDAKSFTELLPAAYKKVPTIVANDAALAGYAEAVYGSGKDNSRVLYLTLSTGVGGAFIANKDVKCVFKNFEPGHQIIIEGGRFNSACGQKGCLEAYVSGTAFKNIYGINPEDCTDTRIWTKYSEHLATGVTNLIVLLRPDVIVFGGKITQKFEYIYKGLIYSLEQGSFLGIPKIKLSKFGDDSGLIGGFSALSRVLK